MAGRGGLWLEWHRAYEQFGPGPMADLLKLGVSPSILLDALVGAEKIEVDGKLYHPSEDGVVAIILPIIEWVPNGPYLDDQGYIHSEGPPEFEPVIPDLVAWHPCDPEHWWCRRGEPALMLGEVHFETAAWLECPVKVFQTPLNWLRNSCRGVVLINQKGLKSAFTGIKYLDAEDLHHGRDLHDWLTQRDPVMPEVRVPESEVT